MDLSTNIAMRPIVIKYLVVKYYCNLLSKLIKCMDYGHQWIYALLSVF